MNLKEIEIRKSEILKESETADLKTLKLLNEEMDDLNAYAEELRKKEVEKVEKRKEIADKIAFPSPLEVNRVSYRPNFHW